jgi:hypothetical protein
MSAQDHISVPGSIADYPAQALLEAGAGAPDKFAS